MLSYFHKEDVEVPKRKSSSCGSRKEISAVENIVGTKKGEATTTRKKKSDTLSLEPDEECISIFEVSNAKSTKKSTSISLEKPLETEPLLSEGVTVKKISSDPISFLGQPSKECATPFDEDLPLEAVDLDHDMEEDVFTVPSSMESHDSVEHVIVLETKSSDNMAENSCKLSPERKSAGINSDSGYNSFTDESVNVSCSMFYPPLLESDDETGKNVFIEHCRSTLKSMSLKVKGFLTRSPPPLDELLNLENVMSTIGHDQLDILLKNKPIVSRKEKCQENDLFTSHPNISKTVAVNSDLRISTRRTMEHEVSFPSLVEPNIKSPKLDVLHSEVTLQQSLVSSASMSLQSNLKSCGSDKSSLKATDTDKFSNTDWHDLFDAESEEDSVPEQILNYCPLRSPHASVLQDTCADDEHITDLATEDSIDLFEDELLLDIESPSKSTLESITILDMSVDGKGTSLNSFKSTTDLKGDSVEATLFSQMKKKSSTEPEQLENANDKFDCSEDLFSITFDLGTCFEDSDEDPPAKSAEAEKANTVEKADGISDSLRDDSSIRDDRRVDLNCSITPLSLYNEESLIGEKRSTPVASCRNIRFVKTKQNSTISTLNSTKETQYASPVSYMPTKPFFTPLGEKWTDSGLCERRFECLSKDDKVETTLTPAKKRIRNADAVKTKLINSRFGSVEIPVKTKDIEATNTCMSPNFAQEEIQQCSNNVEKQQEIQGNCSESEDEVVFRRKRKNVAVLNTSEVTNSDCEFDSPVHAVKKSRQLLNTSELSDDDLEFVNTAKISNTESAKSVKKQTGIKGKRKHLARQFLDEEAELSSDGADNVSSDEDDDSEDEHNASVTGFLNDNTQFSQALNDSEMHGVYMNSVRSPAVGHRFKMVPNRARASDLTVFSQIPEQDETYMEDSFCVQECTEDQFGSRMASSDEEDAAIINFDLLDQDSFVDGRRQYYTRRRAKTKPVRTEQNADVDTLKKKVSRIIVPDDSSEEEMDVGVIIGPAVMTLKTDNERLGQRTASFQKPLPVGPNVQFKNRSAPALPFNDRCQARLNMKASVSEALDFQPENRSANANANWRKEDARITSFSTAANSVRSVSASSTSASCSSTASERTYTGTRTSIDPAMKDGQLCILADTREISAGPEIISCLKSTHAVKVQICSLSGCDYIVSNRMAVERKLQSEFANCSNRNKLIDRIQHLHSLFERICLIVEKDRIKPGDTSRLFQRTKYYDSMLSSLIAAGIRIIFSSGQEDTAGLLKELALVEQRKKVAISVPTEVLAHKQDALQFYLSIPNVSYIAALNMCQRFATVKQMTNSSITEIVSSAQVSHHKAEEIYRYIHYGFDAQMLPQRVANVKQKSSC